MVAAGIVAFSLSAKSFFLDWIHETCDKEILNYATKVNEKIMRLDAAMALILLEETFNNSIHLSKTLQSRFRELADLLNHDMDEINSISANPRKLSNSPFFYVNYWDPESLLDTEQNVSFTDSLYDIFIHSPYIPSNWQ